LKYLAKYFLNKQSTKIFFLFPIHISLKKYFWFVMRDEENDDMIIN